MVTKNTAAYLCVAYTDADSLVAWCNALGVYAQEAVRHASDETLTYLLLRACLHGRIDVISQLLTHSCVYEIPPFLKYRSYGRYITPIFYPFKVVDYALILAASKGHKELVEMLLDHGAYINAFDGNCVCSLTVSAANGHKEVVKLLLDRGVDIRRRSSALSAAAENGHKEVVDFLLSHGVKVDYFTWILTVRKGHKEIVELLLDRGADVRFCDYFSLETAEKKVIRN